MQLQKMKNGIDQLRSRLMNLKGEYFGSYEELLNEFKEIAKRKDLPIRSFKNKKNEVQLVEFLNNAHKFYLRDIVEKGIGKNYHITLTDALLRCIEELEKPIENLKEIDLIKNIFFDYLVLSNNYLQQLFDSSLMKKDLFLQFLVANPFYLFADYNSENNVLSRQVDFQNFLIKNQTINKLTLNAIYSQNSKNIFSLYQIGLFLRQADIYNANKRMYLMMPDLMKTEPSHFLTDFHYYQKLCKYLNINTDIIDSNSLTIENQTYDLQLIKQNAIRLSELAEFLFKTITQSNIPVLEGLSAIYNGSDNTYKIPSYITFSKEDIQTIYHVYKSNNSLEINDFFITTDRLKF